jgi:ribosomal protein S18 acetylase RimI-like enzyme
VSEDKARVRPVRPDDRDALEATLRSDETFREEEVKVALELVDDAIRGSEDYGIKVATLSDDAGGGERVAGYICYGPTPMTDGTFDLYWIVTHVEARGRGVAGTLIQAMEQDLAGRGGGAIRVETSQLDGYEAARRLYEGRGYAECGRLPGFYRAGDDLIIYYKQL